MYWQATVPDGICSISAFSHFHLLFSPLGTTSTSRCCWPLWTCMSLLTSTWCKRSGEQCASPTHTNTHTATCALSVALTRPPLPVSPRIAGSSCGVSVCPARPRRSTAWWRRLLPVTASATRASSSPQVRHWAGGSSTQRQILWFRFSHTKHSESWLFGLPFLGSSRHQTFWPPAPRSSSGGWGRWLRAVDVFFDCG